MKEEIWKSVLGYEGIYEVSSLGRVRSVDRIVSGRNRWGGCPERKKGKVICQRPNNWGYMIVRLNRDGKYKAKLVHRLVAVAFLPVPAGGKNQVNHKDGNKDNNTVSNLEWVTSRENTIHKYKVLGYKNIGRMGKAGKLIVCVDTGETFRSAGEVVRKYGGTSSGLLYAIARENNVYHGKKFIYKNIEKGI